MKGRLGVFNHPYYTVTDVDGNFEIQNLSAGKLPLMIYHEYQGYRLGLNSKDGEKITVTAGVVTDLGDLPMGK
jgi:hypothetical protein